MSRHRFLSRLASLAFLALLIAPMMAAAAEPRIQITPFVGYRLEGEFDIGGEFDFFNPFDDLTVDESESVGLVVDFAVSRNFMIELIFSQQESELQLEGPLFGPDEKLFDLDVNYYHVGFIYRWMPGQVHPFLGASVGLTRLEASGIDGGDLDRPSFSLGGGATVFVTKNIGFRFEGRAFWTFIDDDVQDLCDFGCRRDDSVFLIQPEVRTGIVFAF
jgi:opacity protein-like surface antigen